MTGMWNQRRYGSMCKEYAGSYEKKIVEVYYANLNDGISVEARGGLTADQAIRTFSLLMTDTFGKDKCYRIGENELAVIVVGGSGDTFRRRAELFSSRIANSEFNFVSLAYISDNGSETVEEVVDKARKKCAF